MIRSELLSLLGKDAVAYVLKPPFTHYDGFEWVQPVPPELFAEPPDSNVFPSRSRLLLCENELLLGPGHATDADVVGIGNGNYVHWAANLYFSTSDNSDPNTNGRTYSVVVGPRRANLVAFGSCHVDMMLRAMTRRKPVNQIYTGALTHNTAEMIQFVQICRGRIEIPPSLFPYILPNPDLAILENQDTLGAADGMILEVCNADEILFGSYYLNRNLLEEQLLQPLQRQGDPIQPIVNNWFFNGILGHKENVRAAAADQLLALIPSGNPEADMRREILRHTRSRRQDEQGLKNDIATLCKMVSPNAWVLGHILRYMPDGRPIHWPPTFMRQMSRICHDLSLPLVDPAKVVQEKGVEFSLENERYYTRKFIDEMSDKLYQIWVDLPKKGEILPTV